MSNIERKLACIKKIKNIVPIQGADFVCSYQIDGWYVVDKKDKYAIGDLVIYFQIDSWIPTEIAPFLSKDNEPKEYNGVKGERLRTTRLKGALSQGLIVPLFPVCNSIDPSLLVENFDLTTLLNIQKYEAPIPACLDGIAKGAFPSFIQKTDQERIQNIVDFSTIENTPFEVTEKLDGSSCTIYFNDGIFGVCSRNLELKYDISNTFWRIAIENNLEQKLRELGKNIALQGETIGSKIQGGRYNIDQHKFYVFDVYDIDNACYYNSIKRNLLVESLELLHVPIVNSHFIIDSNSTIDSLLLFAEDTSTLNKNTQREGLVFKSIKDPSVSFKAISNKFLLKHQ